MKIAAFLLVMAGLATSTGFLAQGIMNRSKGFEDYVARASVPIKGDYAAKPMPVTRTGKVDY